MHLSNSYFSLLRSRWLSVPLNEAWKPNSGTASSVNSWSFHIEQINPYSVRLLIYMHISIIAPIILLTYHLFPVSLWACCCCHLVTKSGLTLCNRLDCSPPGSSVNGISQVRILEWVAICFTRGSSWPRDRTCVSCIGRWILYYWDTRKVQRD